MTACLCMIMVMMVVVMMTMINDYGDADGGDPSCIHKKRNRNLQHHVYACMLCQGALGALDSTHGFQRLPELGASTCKFSGVGGPEFSLLWLLLATRISSSSALLTCVPFWSV